MYLYQTAPLGSCCLKKKDTKVKRQMREQRMILLMAGKEFILHETQNAVSSE